LARAFQFSGRRLGTEKTTHLAEVLALFGGWLGGRGAGRSRRGRGLGGRRDRRGRGRRGGRGDRVPSVVLRQLAQQARQIPVFEQRLGQTGDEDARLGPALALHQAAETGGGRGREL